MNIFKLFTLIASLFVLFSCKEENKKIDNPSQTDSKKPNVIYILADDLGYGDLGCYGQEKIKTPILDQLANEGLVFTNHYAGNTVCAPSRASLLTGLHQGHAPVRGNNSNELSVNDFTIANMFKQAGYTTAMIGKWGLGEVGTTGEPSKQGFDSYYGYLNQIIAHNYYPDHLIRDGDSIMLNNKITLQTEGYAKGIGQAATIKNDYSHNLFVTEALNFIEKSKDKPFFLYLPFTIPHANNEGELTAKHGMEVPDLGIYAKENWPDVEKSKAAMISLLDTDVGRILDKLEVLNLTKNTLVIFTSDNGPHAEGGVDPEFFNSNGALKGIKRDLYEGGIRVPFIAYWQGKIWPNTKSELPTAFWDMMPTFAELTEVNLDHKTDGISFLPTLLGDSDRQKKHEYLYWEFAEGAYDAQAVRSENWKLVHIYLNNSWELYDLSKDLGEENNVIAEQPEITAKLKAYLKKAHIYDVNYPLEGE